MKQLNNFNSKWPLGVNVKGGHRGVKVKKRHMVTSSLRRHGGLLLVACLLPSSLLGRVRSKGSHDMVLLNADRPRILQSFSPIHKDPQDKERLIKIATTEDPSNCTVSIMNDTKCHEQKESDAAAATPAAAAAAAIEMPSSVAPNTTELSILPNTQFKTDHSSDCISEGVAQRDSIMKVPEVQVAHTVPITSNLGRQTQVLSNSNINRQKAIPHLILNQSSLPQNMGRKTFTTAQASMLFSKNTLELGMGYKASESKLHRLSFLPEQRSPSHKVNVDVHSKLNSVVLNPPIFLLEQHKLLKQKVFSPLSQSERSRSLSNTVSSPLYSRLPKPKSY